MASGGGGGGFSATTVSNCNTATIIGLARGRYPFFAVLLPALQVPEIIDSDTYQ